jgi:hypothetical protein
VTPLLEVWEDKKTLHHLYFPSQNCHNLLEDKVSKRFVDMDDVMNIDFDSTI